VRPRGKKREGERTCRPKAIVIYCYQKKSGKKEGEGKAELFFLHRCGVARREKKKSEKGEGMDVFYTWSYFGPKGRVQEKKGRKTALAGFSAHGREKESKKKGRDCLVISSF